MVIGNLCNKKFRATLLYRIIAGKEQLYCRPSVFALPSPWYPTSHRHSVCGHC